MPIDQKHKNTTQNLALLHYEIPGLIQSITRWCGMLQTRESNKKHALPWTTSKFPRWYPISL